MNPADPKFSRLPGPVGSMPEILEPGLQWVALTTDSPFEALPLAAMGVDALGRPVLLLDANDLQAGSLLALIDAVGLIRREGPPLSSTFLLPEEVRVFLLGDRVHPRTRRRLQVLAGAFPLAWWTLDGGDGEELRLRPVPVESLPTETWSAGVPEATRAALHRLLRGAGRLRPQLQLMPLAGGIQLRHQERPVAVLFLHRQEVFARTVGVAADLLRLSRPLVVDRLLDDLLGHLVLEKEGVSVEA